LALLRRPEGAMVAQVAEATRAPLRLPDPFDSGRGDDAGSAARGRGDGDRTARPLRHRHRQVVQRQARGADVTAAASAFPRWCLAPLDAAAETPAVRGEVERVHAAVEVWADGYRDLGCIGTLP
jgi:hypothetical protein